MLKKREQWMVELPPDMTKNFGVTSRKFSLKKESSVDKDRSAWTDTPADRARKEQVLCRISIGVSAHLCMCVIIVIIM